MEAMQQFVGRLLGSQDPAHLKGISSETTAAELSQLLFWLLVVGEGGKRGGVKACDRNVLLSLRPVQVYSEGGSYPLVFRVQE